MDGMTARTHPLLNATEEPPSMNQLFKASLWYTVRTIEGAEQRSEWLPIYYNQKAHDTCVMLHVLLSLQAAYYLSWIRAVYIYMCLVDIVCIHCAGRRIDYLFMYDLMYRTRQRGIFLLSPEGVRIGAPCVAIRWKKIVSHFFILHTMKHNVQKQKNLTEKRKGDRRTIDIQYFTAGISRRKKRRCPPKATYISGNTQQYTR